MEPRALVGTYYRCIDEGDYAALEDALAPSFSQVRPDRTFDSRRAFRSFMEAERPRHDTVHQVHDIVAEGDRVAVTGTLLDAAGAQLFEFADVFTIEDDRIVALDTYTR